MIRELERQLTSIATRVLREAREPGLAEGARAQSEWAPADRPSPRDAAGLGESEADFRLSLSTTSIRLAEMRIDPGSSETRSSSNAPATAPVRPTPSSRTIDAYREVTRASVGDRVRIVV
jgi:hypothetical protein